HLFIGSPVIPLAATRILEFRCRDLSDLLSLKEARVHEFVFLPCLDDRINLNIELTGKVDTTHLFRLFCLFCLFRSLLNQQSSGYWPRRREEEEEEAEPASQHGE